MITTTAPAARIADLPDMVLTDAMIDTLGRCTCHAVIQGTEVSFTYYALGVTCPACQEAEWAADRVAAYNRLTQPERRARVAAAIDYRWTGAVARFADRTLRGRIDPWAGCAF